jgi:hypothetical protein
VDGEAPERLELLLDQVRERQAEMVPPNGSAQGGHEVARALAMLKKA